MVIKRMNKQSKKAPRTPLRKGSREAISYNMSRIKGKDTAIERKLGHAMFASGLRYRKQYDVVGRPDFAFPGLKIAIFCDSAFWHGKDWENSQIRIKTNRDFWIPKIERNIARDTEVNQELQDMGWLVLRFWDEDIKHNTSDCMRMIVDAVRVRKENRAGAR